MLLRLFLSVCLLINLVQIEGCTSPSPINLDDLNNKPISCPTIGTCFTPGQDCISAITQHIQTARKTIDVQAYQFTSQAIADALISAKNRKVLIKVILDKSQVKSKQSMLSCLYKAGIPIWIDTKPAIAHNKVMIIDDKEVITGSFNFTDAAEKRNAENVAFIYDRKVAQSYIKNWNNRQKQSKRWPY